MGKLVKVQFTATDGMRGYHRWPSGDIREVSEAEANRLLADFPGNFALVLPEPEKPAEPVIEEKAAPLEDAPNKAIKTGKNKGKW